MTDRVLTAHPQPEAVSGAVVEEVFGQSAWSLPIDTTDYRSETTSGSRLTNVPLFPPSKSITTPCWPDKQPEVTSGELCLRCRNDGDAAESLDWAGLTRDRGHPLFVSRGQAMAPGVW